KLCSEGPSGPFNHQESTASKQPLLFLSIITSETGIVNMNVGLIMVSGILTVTVHASRKRLRFYSTFV
ncbi:MAG: hypothetical protein MSH32_07005, partial [Lachnospiraceae bacterium]|nr:hypothetical protein [Lachnospiraceae bacterium]